MPTSADWPHTPEELRVGDVFIARATQYRGGMTVRAKRRSVSEGGFWIALTSALTGQSGRKLYYFGEEIRITGKGT
jgi:hypothetical protein